MKTIILCLAAGLFISACSLANPADKNKGPVSDTEIGLRNVDLNDENNVANPDIKWLGDAPGTNKTFDRSFENAPPLIPHSLEGLVPIVKDSNSCLSCHVPEVAKDAGTIPAPKSHLVDLRTGKDLNGQVSDERFNCTQCHVPQADVKPLKKNNFKADFRYKDSNESSNLLDILNQGI
ncbi:nitrate reductase cytochrome c-type subunit [Campylobacter fetus]|uniref:Periplasmic nitrate reductase, electron transfer subunit n=1 Tax=Campylobacter fetus subsp. testudinum TaxID=1507806 RepID=A0AAX0HDJ0_CAMFE|nr:nitrate reductase cytochrome c-type subunit [Campylobacter fetus]AGZ81995.1 periplasmic nitrate reductase NapAB, small subunit, periplasmic diheme cytochrome c550 protein [Campylobacter fetus subsp. testudinum 03-427]AJB45731.1 nitrate reductase [Campylobacter fetus subsp. testudinum]ALV65161.1 periplasmic nitrate reductase NapAB, small subunit, periplasmic diheme cytochrome c550 protein [Campylobacter fetus subsp. testudinum Sp3]AVK81431.1 nitrate reductase [Campylobacter fetus subsp. testu